MFSELNNFIKGSCLNFQEISEERKAILNKLIVYVQRKKDAKEDIQLTFICTHNSRRSHVAQLLSSAAANYYKISNVKTYSGGTEATTFNPLAVKALEKAGFKIEKSEEAENPVYSVQYAEDMPAVKSFSKKYDHEVNPSRNYAAIMVCSSAEKNCPAVYGSEERIGITYLDPKAFDNTDQEEQKYFEKVIEIGKEIFYVFSLIK